MDGLAHLQQHKLLTARQAGDIVAAARGDWLPQAQPS